MAMSTTRTQPRFRQGSPIHRIRHPRDDAHRPAARRRQPRPGLPRFRVPARAQGGRVARRSTTTSTSTRSPGAPRTSATRSPPRRSGSIPTWSVDPQTNITVTCGATEGMIAAMLALLEPGRRGRRLRAVLRELRARRDPVRRGPALRHAARARLVGSTSTSSVPPSGHERAASCSTRRTTRRARCSRVPSSSRSPRCASSTTCIVFTDDIYEHILYAGVHIPMATLPGMAERTSRSTRCPRRIRSRAGESAG